MPVSYLMSGGVSLRSLLPGAAFPLVRPLERGLTPWMSSLTMIARIRLERITTYGYAAGAAVRDSQLV